MPPMHVRMPAVAGRFYPWNAIRLAHDLDGYLAPQPAEATHGAMGCVVPHAGYIYSGRVAGSVYRKLPACSCFVVIGPNHFGQGAPLAIMSDGAWRTPLGEAIIHHDLAVSIQRQCASLVEDSYAHAGEHSLEVQIPFLQRRMVDFTFVPIAVGAVEYEELVDLGHGIGRALGEFAGSAIIIASSDMNHYEPDTVTRAKDAKAIDRILALDQRGLYDVVKEEGISMCGAGPAVAMLTAVNDLGAAHAILEKYATSADAGGGPESVVGYAGIVVQA